jgi:NAD(P)-dependent dehydrogenase (short-subunit alcohol dehydrogenase family)
VPTDVTDEAAVTELARRAVQRFGRIDVWVNNAGVYLLGSLEATPPEAFRRVLETNFFGYVHGARAVLPRFREQGHGVLINNASVYSHLGAPWLTAYVSSKFAVRGFSEALRQELGDLPNVHICTVSPSPIDTPIFASAANYSGRAVKAPPPTYPPEQVARVLIGLLPGFVLQHALLGDVDPADFRSGLRTLLTTRLDSQLPSATGA